jgi:amino acid permease
MVLSTFGYFTFLSGTKPNYLLNDYHHSVPVVLAAIGLCLVCSLAIPLFIHAKRRSITTLYFDHFYKESAMDLPLLLNQENKILRDRGSSYDSEESESSILSGPTMVETPELAFAAHRPLDAKKKTEATRQLSIGANLIICLAFLSLEAFVSLYISNIGVVLAFLGSTNFPICCYIFPTLALWKLRAQCPNDKDINSKLLVIVTSSTVIVSMLGVVGLLVQFKIVT